VYELIGVSPAMARTRKEIEKIAGTGLPVLIIGPTGVGKEIVARLLHEASGRRDAFVALDCGAISVGLIESELFGHERGAFTGANQRRVGLVAAAAKGTFYLDEIGELSLETQSRLLRLLEEGTYRPVGAQKEEKADIRVIAATWRPLQALVESGQFRLDLYHRLSVMEIYLPPLRERPEDIDVLFDHFLARAKENGEGVVPTLSEKLRSKLREYAWPGNVRELRNLVEYFCAMHPGRTVGPRDLPERFRVGRESSREIDDYIRLDLPYLEARRDWLDLFQQRYVDALLAEHDGNISGAARAAGMDRRSIQRILKRRELPKG
jgi:DNA-binding NtrC family response regulator